MTTKAIAELMTATRRTSIWSAKVWSCVAKAGSVSLVPEMLAKEKTSPTSPATTHTTPEALAYLAAVIRREVLLASG
ncbi:MAG TPA: hypothetical protein VIP78_01895, partial [Candidatus Dormibacteraeota bacterium]